MSVNEISFEMARREQNLRAQLKMALEDRDDYHDKWTALEEETEQLRGCIKKLEGYCELLQQQNVQLELACNVATDIMWVEGIDKEGYQH